MINTRRDYIIAEEVLQKTLNYLATKKYSEVFALITEIQTNIKLNDNDESTTELKKINE